MSEYDLKKSEKGIGQLYPILEAKDGEVIDGLHREQADKGWKRVRLEHIDTEEKKLVARLVANFHRRQITREEKIKWINGLARIYQEQGLKIKGKLRIIEGKSIGNEIVARIMDVTGLSDRSVYEYLDEKFKRYQLSEPRKVKPKVLASQRIETKLGSEVAERFREEVLAEEKLSPEEKLELEKKREEAKRKREEQKKLELIKTVETYRTNLIKLIENAEKFIDADKFLSEIKKLQIKGNPKVAHKEMQKIRKQVLAEKKKEEQNLQEEKIRKQAEQLAKNLKAKELIKDKNFQREVLAEIQKVDVPQKPNVEVVGEDEKQGLKKYLTNYAEALKQVAKYEPKRNDVDTIKRLFFGLCQERNISFKCPHCGRSFIPEDDFE